MSENNNNNDVVDQNPVPEKTKKTQFPEGLRVLAVDDDMTCLKTLAVMLRKCQYQVTETTKATEALDLLRKNKDNYDIVITDVRMPDMDGFELLRIIGLEMDVPVIMMSAYDDTSNVMKGIRHGARDYLVKPVRMLELKNIWQHVIRKTILNPNKSSVMTKEDMENLPLKKRRNRSMEIEEEENTRPDGDSVAAKKPRFAWTKELHKKFVDAVQQLDAERAVPKKILEVMNEPQLTREIIASHLQKYRNFLKKQQDSMSEGRTSNAGLNWAHGGVLNTTSTTSSNSKVLSVLGRANSSGEYSSSVDGILSFRDQFLSKPDTNTSLLNEGLMSVPLNQQNLLLQQNIHSSRMADQVQPPKTIPLLETVSSGSAWVTNPSRMMVNDYIDMSSQIPNGAGQSHAPIGYTNFGTVQSRPPGFPGFVVRQPCLNKVPMAGLVSYPCPPGAFNIVRTPNHMLGNASTQISLISHPNSLPGQHEGRSLTVFNGRTGLDFRGWSTGHQEVDKSTVNCQGTFMQLLTDTIEIEDDDFNAALKQFGKTSAPAL